MPYVDTLLASEYANNSSSQENSVIFINIYSFFDYLFKGRCLTIEKVPEMNRLLTDGALC